VDDVSDYSRCSGGHLAVSVLDPRGVPLLERQHGIRRLPVVRSRRVLALRACVIALSKHRPDNAMLGGRELYVDVNFNNMMGVSQLCNDSAVELVCMQCVRDGHVQHNTSLSVISCI